MAQVDTAESGPEGPDGPGGADAGNGRRGRRRVRDIRNLTELKRRLSAPGPWRRGLLTAALSLLLGLVMLFHAGIPNRIGSLGSLVETFLPWLGLLVVPLAAAALLRRSASAAAALLLPVFVWTSLFGGLLTDKAGPGGDLTVVSHNVAEQNLDYAATARALIASGADLVALEEITRTNRDAYAAALAKEYPHHQVLGTVGVWSRLPLSDTRPVDLRLGWTRALRTTVATGEGPVAVYVAHLPSVRVKLDAGFTAGRRDASVQALGEAVEAEPLNRVVLLGDLNGTMNDRALAPLTSQLRSAQGAAGDGFGFSFPADFPMARIDQILVRGAEPASSWVLPATGSDHRPVGARVTL
ncbi:endonuclease/exonuclease/phosphatase family protein [Streptomyces polyrhachis]|uniref:Endonuclease/exonuclease/phosphatase family protein n=1 Tax=Streptomyces polyrhachis TaxID=1282885 RepID=A0ABW2GH38_9ACTN